MTQRGANRRRGFSLLELLCVVVVTALLAAIALPTYASHVARARRVAGRTTLLSVAHWLERAATATGQYPPGAAIPPGLLKGDGGYYRFTADTEAETDHFVISAVPAGTHAGDRCGTLSLLETGERRISHAVPDATVDACWNR